MDYTTDIIAFMDHVQAKFMKNNPDKKLPPQLMLGHSMGGAITIQTVLNNPQRV